MKAKTSYRMSLDNSLNNLKDSSMDKDKDYNNSNLNKGASYPKQRDSLRKNSPKTKTSKGSSNRDILPNNISSNNISRTDIERI